MMCDNGRRPKCSSGTDDSEVSFARISRAALRLAAAAALISSACGSLLAISSSSSFVHMSTMVASGVPNSCAGRRRQAVQRRKMLFALQHKFGRRQRVGQLPRLLGDAKGVETP